MEDKLYAYLASEDADPDMVGADELETEDLVEEEEEEEEKKETIE